MTVLCRDSVKIQSSYSQIREYEFTSSVGMLPVMPLSAGVAAAARYSPPCRWSSSYSTAVGPFATPNSPLARCKATRARISAGFFLSADIGRLQSLNQ